MQDFRRSVVAISRWTWKAGEFETGGFAAIISRWLSEAIPPVVVYCRFHPSGMAARHDTALAGIPLGFGISLPNHTGGIAFAQPPANGCETSGFNSATSSSDPLRPNTLARRFLLSSHATGMVRHADHGSTLRKSPRLGRMPSTDTRRPRGN